jgi:heat shock protein HslJ
MRRSRIAQLGMVSLLIATFGNSPADARIMESAIALKPFMNSPTYLAAASQPGLAGTAWQLVSWSLADSENAPLADTQVTAEFTADGVAGTASCNRYRAGYQVDGGALTVSGAITTRMACPQPIMTQEYQFIRALEGAKRYEVVDQQLQISYETPEGAGKLVFAPLQAQPSL